ncbi:MAG: hypothetical protein HC900_03745, partial [Methylacidiphilales bacterium]|nr:hypothetical protein [Candidatus Methylacidiphilales bacterium]
MTPKRPPSPGRRPERLGATFDAGAAGVHFAIQSHHASRLTLCLFDAEGREEVRQVAMARDGDIHHAFVAG